MAQELVDKIRAAAQAKGIDPDIALRIAQAESAFKTNATPGTSSAGGLFQVVDKTWKEFGGKPGKKFDPDENIRVGTDIIAKNTQSLKSFLQRDPRPSEIYAAHYFGATGAKSFLAAQPGTPMESLFSAEVIKANPNLKGKTSDQVMSTLETKMGDKPAARAPAAAAPKKELPPSLPPMAAAPAPAAPAMKEQVANLGPGYQAALALSFLSDTDEKEDRDLDREPGIAEKWLAQQDAKPQTSSLAEFADVKIRSPFAEPAQPQMLAHGGAVQHLAGGGLPFVPSPRVTSSARKQLESIKAQYDAYNTQADAYNAAIAAYNAGPRESDFTGTPPTIPGTSVEQYQALGAKARKDAANRGLALQVAANPEQFNLSMNSLFNKGGEAKKSNVVDDVGKWLAKNDITPSDLLTALGRVGTAAGTALAPSTLNEGEAEELARRRKLPPTVDRAKGSPEEGEESLDTYYAPKARPSTGLNRKEGPISQALNSGEAYVNVAKGLTEMPYNLAGAPMDIAMLVRQGLTGRAPEGQVGTSDYIKKKMTELGIRPAPPTNPTARGFYDAGDLLSNVVNPAGVTRAGVKTAQAVGKQTGEAAKMLAKDFQQYNQQLSVPGASYAVRNKGTPFLMGYERTQGPDGAFPAIDQAAKYIKNDVAVTGDPKLNDWLSSRLTSYLRRDFATPDDQFVKAADDNQLLHFVNKPMKRTDLDPYYDRIRDFSSMESLPYVRRTEGFDPQGLAKTPYGKRAEDLTDNAAWPVQLEDITSPGMIPRNMDRTDPSARLTELGTNIDEMLQFDKLAADMERMRSMPRSYSAYSQPGIKVPDEYLLTDEMLVGLTPAQASNRVAKFRKWEEDARQGMASKALFEDPSISRTPAEGGGVWVNPDDLAENPNMLNLVQDVGCDGGWCTKDEGSALNYGSDENRLSILMDSKARPQAQLTITSRQYTADDFLFSMTDDEAVAFKAKYPDIASYNGNAIMNTPEFQQSKAMNPDGYSITEIKGTNNRTDFENVPYLKQIQQQVKNLDSQLKVNDVKDLDKIGMVDLRSVLLNINRPFDQNYMGRLLKANGGSHYIDKDEATSFIKKLDEMPPTQRATGGMIERQSTDSRRYL